MNKCRADFRRRNPPSVELDEHADLVPVTAGRTPAEAAIAAETATLVAAAVAELPPGQRSVLVMRIWNGLSYAEIAEAMDVAQPTVRSHMYHALTAVRKYLEPRLK
jgi:RNA polymerase sigma-70 factor (ECF subfamily)